MAYIISMGDGKVIGSSAMGRLVDLTDFQGSGYTDGGYVVQTSNGFKIVSGVVVGDLEMSDLACEKCGRAFQEGEELTFIVVAAGPKTIRTRPVHRFCSSPKEE